MIQYLFERIYLFDLSQLFPGNYKVKHFNQSKDLIRLECLFFIFSAPHMHCFGLEILKDHLKPGIEYF